MKLWYLQAPRVGKASLRLVASIVSNAAVLLNRARIQMDLAADYLDQGMRLVAENQIDGVEGLLERAQNRFDNFDETPKTEMGRARASELATGFNTVMGLVRDQYAALKAGELSECTELHFNGFWLSPEVWQSLTSHPGSASQATEPVPSGHLPS